MMRPAVILFFAGLSLDALQSVVVGQDGKIAFNTHCRNCHSMKADDNRLGPSLHGIVGAPAGQVAGYRGYSGSLKGFSWDEATLDRFIANPRSVAPNTNMIYPPVNDPHERAKIIELLKTPALR